MKWKEFGIWKETHSLTVHHHFILGVEFDSIVIHRVPCVLLHQLLIGIGFALCSKMDVHWVGVAAVKTSFRGSGINLIVVLNFGFPAALCATNSMAALLACSTKVCTISQPYFWWCCSSGCKVFPDYEHRVVEERLYDWWWSLKHWIILLLSFYASVHILICLCAFTCDEKQRQRSEQFWTWSLIGA